MCGFHLSDVPSTLAALAIPILTAAETAASTTPPAQAPASPLQLWVAFVSALAWPVAAIVIALAFRKPLGQFLSGLAGRVTKLSAFKVELELAATPSAASSPLLDDIRSTTTPAAISDSTRTMLEQAQSTLPADFAVINLGAGEEWLTSRLFIASVMLERMRGVQVFVFLESSPTTSRRFVAIGSLAEIRWSLACKFPWLEAAWVRAYLSVFPAYPPSSTPAGVFPPTGAAWLPDPTSLNMAPSPFQSSTGALDPWMARSLVSQFIQLLQEVPTAAAPPGTPNPGAAPIVPLPPPPHADSWVTFASGTRERANWLTRPMLETFLSPEAFELWTDEARDAPRTRRTRSVLRRPGPFVALVQGDREYVRLVNRSVLLEEMAAWFGEEPE